MTYKNQKPTLSQLIDARLAARVDAAKHGGIGNSSLALEGAHHLYIVRVTNEDATYYYYRHGASPDMVRRIDYPEIFTMGLVDVNY